MRKLVYCEGRYCPPCRYIKATYIDKYLTPVIPDNVECIICEDHLEFCRKNNIKVTPTWLFFDENVVQYRYEGVPMLESDDVINWLKGNTNDLFEQEKR